MKKDTELGQNIANIMKEGGLVPSVSSLFPQYWLTVTILQDVTVTLLKAAMLERDQANGFLIDGFPREMEQAKIFEENVNFRLYNCHCSCTYFLQVCSCARVLLFKCSDEVMTERLKQRGLTSGRTDDNKETIRKRLQTFHQHTIPVISHYQQNNKVWEVST